MKKVFRRTKLPLTTETVRQISDNQLGTAAAGAAYSCKTQYGVQPCNTVLCWTLQYP